MPFSTSRIYFALLTNLGFYGNLFISTEIFVSFLHNFTFTFSSFAARMQLFLFLPVNRIALYENLLLDATKVDSRLKLFYFYGLSTKRVKNVLWGFYSRLVALVRCIVWKTLLTLLS